MPATMATSERSSSEAGGLMPPEPCTMLMESSTVTICDRPAELRSISVRPRQGNTKEVSPGTRCEWLSLVAMLTVSFCFSKALTISGLSGVARMKLPPSAMKA
ncbi:hypothetical protein D3C72_2108580 [compost metagenome]